MNVIVTGATGFIGSHIVSECVASPDISTIIILTRKSVLENDGSKLKGNPKVIEIIHNDFSQYPESLLDQLKGAEACIWAIGGRVPQFPDLDTAKRVGVDYTLAAAEAFRQHLVPSLQATNSTKFRFVYCSGWGAAEDPSKKLWIAADSRKIKGLAEKGLFDIATRSRPDDTFQVYCLRPGGVIAPGSKAIYPAVAVISPAVMVTDLAKAFVIVATKGYSKPIIENGEIVKMGK